jgi:carbamoyltransferase
MNILGISCFYHDSAASLVMDGQLVAAAAEERFSRRKHDSGYPDRAIRYCLEEGRITKESLDYVVFYEKPLLKFDRILTSCLATFPRSSRLFRESMLTWFSEKLWIKGQLLDQLGISSDRLVFCPHHLSHAASAFYPSPFQEAAILTVDGVGEWTTATMGVGKGTEIRLERELRWPHSLGMLYSAFTSFLGFEVNEGEYKVMGMAPYGSPRYLDKVWKTVRMGDDGAIELNLDYFSFHKSPSRAFSNKFVSLFGAPRQPTSNFFTRSSGYPSYFGAQPGDFVPQQRLNEHYADIAASIQRVTEDIILRMVEETHRRTGLRRLCLAGGVALNSVANGRILKETPIEELFVQPAAGDDGGSLGAALHVWHALLGKPRSFRMNHAYWGKGYGDNEIELELMKGGFTAIRASSEDALLNEAAADLEQGKVIGWYQGRFEWGPRALGNRSILADPRRIEMKDIVNTKIKFREPYRPFAPSIMSEHVGDYFQMRHIADQPAAKFMLCVCEVKEERRNDIPSVVHVDGSARPQVVERASNPLYHSLISRFRRATGVPLILNTSFNLRGEPIVSTPKQALSTFERSEMDSLYLGRYWIKKPCNGRASI